ncbi:iron-sulfur cluster assembly protein [Halomarina halobia]|uniref:Iron-sulfur cluster assembly protein n=1 Tax=Halomarina halobia TaxID=3033386 RepID=A0ABD6A7L2_9EURY|nr:iron-sulfur cluster assembly protein [Halomarina sp. PSR21]
MSGRASAVTRTAVLDRLDRVTDPELDRSIVELEYVERVEVDPPRVSVRMALPTAWCSPAFAWMMASDAREETLALDGVEAVRVELVDHMHEREITEGVNADRDFEAVFEDATEGVEAVRAVLDDKARLARQYRAVEALLDAGVRPAQVARLRRRDVTLDAEPDRASVDLDGDALVVFVPREPLARYVEKATDAGIAEGPDDRLFATPDGDPFTVDSFDLVHRRARLARTNMTGQGTVCDGLRRARYGSGGGVAETDD